ncbi:MAG: hypothetical protein WAO83_00950 [Fuerstiella sp.]
MVFSPDNIEQQLLESAAGQAVYDSLIQANVNINTVSLELVKQMLVAECQFRKLMRISDSSHALAIC